MAVGGVLESHRLFSEAAAVLDRNNLSKAGRALMKHGDRAASAFPQARGRASEINRAAQEIVDEILADPRSTMEIRHHATFGEVKDIRAPDGRGLRFDGAGSFLGFLEP